MTNKNILSQRYTTPEMNEIFSEEQKIILINWGKLIIIKNKKSKNKK